MAQAAGASLGMDSRDVSILWWRAALAVPAPASLSLRRRVLAGGIGGIGLALGEAITVGGRLGSRRGSCWHGWTMIDDNKPDRSCRLRERLGGGESSKVRSSSKAM